MIIPVSFKFRKYFLLFIAFPVSVLLRRIFQARGEEGCRMYEIIIRSWAKWDRVRGSCAGTRICIIVVTTGRRQ